MSNRTEAARRKLTESHRETTATAPVLDSTQFRKVVMPARLRLSWGMNLETLPSVGARIPRIRVAGDPLCSGLGRGLLPTTSLMGM
jgi:hypothetical protein